MFDRLERIPALPDPTDPRSVDRCLVDLDSARQVENMACHRKVAAALELWECRMFAAAEAGADAVHSGNDVVSEISARLRCSHSAARTLVEVGALLEALPVTSEAFALGEIDYTNLKVVAATFGDNAAQTTLGLLDESIARAAREFTPAALRTQVWTMWMQTDPDEAAAARALRATTDRSAYVRRDGHGLSRLAACLTDTEGSQAQAMLDEITATVCAGDPRRRRTLRADGLMALLHGEAALICGCDNPACEKHCAPPRPRRTPLIQVLVDADTLLRLADQPGILPDGTPLDAEVARTLAEDATWQAIITESRDALTARPEVTDAHTVSTMDSQRTDACDAASAAPLPTDAPATAIRPIDQHNSTPKPIADSVLNAALNAIESRFAGTFIPTPPPPIPPSPRCFLRRGRTLRPGRIPDRPNGAPSTHRPPSTPPRSGPAELIEAWTDTLTHNPGMSIGEFLDGHGGFDTAPPGALTYRPNASVAAIVRAAYPTCTFPGCTVASLRCELDHVVEYDHDDAHAGGWTIPTNLQPLCKRHHDLKTRRYWTCTTLPGGTHCWTHHTGIQRITVPTNSFRLPAEQSDGQAPENAPVEPSCADPLTEAEASDLLYEPTWWEQHMTPADHPGNDPSLLAPYREHQAILARRAALQPPPF
jgi:hypothetical protein